MHTSEIIVYKHLNEISPLQFGYEDCEKGHMFGPAIRQYWLLHYIADGSGIFRINGKTYKLSKGDIFVIPPFVETYYEADNIAPWSYIWIGFWTKQLPIDLPPFIHLPSAHQIFESMKKCANLKNGKNAFLSAKIWELFSLIAETEQESSDEIEMAINYINSEYMNNIKISEISERLHLDRTYFSYAFKKRIGKSPQKYLLDLRLENAAKLLTEQNESPSTAAFSVGYNDIYNFSRMFKQKYGVSPREYKKRSSQK